MAGSPPKSPPSPPPPFPSHPSATELIESYLRPRVLSGAKVGDFIHERDLYAAAPDDLTGQLRPVTAGDGEKAWYFFTTIKFKSMLKFGVNRAVDTGEGRWEEEEESPQLVLSSLSGRSARKIGQRQAFAFVRKEGAREVRSGWFMVELRLDLWEPLVMCKVYRSLSDPKDIDAAASGPRLEIREAGDNDPVAERAAAAAASRGRQKKAVVGEGAGAATTCRAPLDAAEKGKEPAEPKEVEAPAPAVHAMARFPTEAELIDSYLRPWIASGENAGEFIHESDVYADAPDDLARRFTPTTAGDQREEVWYFLRKLRPWGKKSVKRRVDSGKGTWCYSKIRRRVPSDDGSSPRTIGQSQTFTFTRKEAKKQLHLGWMMVELRLNRSNPNALYKVYRSPVAARAGAPGSKEADDETSSAVGLAASGREEDGEEIDSAAAAEPGLNRKAGDKGSGAETAAASPGRQKTAVAESPGAASLDAAEEIEAPAEPEEPDDPSKPKLHKFF